MTKEQFYTAPPQHIFEEIKQKSIEIWKTYNDEFGYATEKINSIKDIENIKDNAWYIVAKFDNNNREKLVLSLSTEARTMLLDVLKY